MAETLQAVLGRIRTVRDMVSTFADEGRCRALLEQIPMCV